jgi:hypothetical protein
MVCYSSREPEAQQAYTKGSKSHKIWKRNWELNVQVQQRYILPKAKRLLKSLTRLNTEVLPQYKDSLYGL